MHRLWLCLTVFLLIPAESIAQRRTVDQVRDSLGRISNTAELRQRERFMGRSPQPNAAALMERGLILLRLYELTRENRDVDEARKTLRRLADREPGSAPAHYALGLALATGPGVRVPSPGGVLDGFVLGQSLAELTGRDPASRAAREFLRALELDPTLAPAAVRLTALVLESRNRDMLVRTRDVLRGIVDAGRASDQITTSLARVQSAMGEVAAAEATVASATNAGAGTLLAQAEALLRQPGKADAGARAYFEGVERSDATALEAYFEDVRIIANERELADWKNSVTQGRGTWLKRFWEGRAAASGKTVAERLAEHYRRLAEAQQRFRRTGKRGGAPLGSMLQQKYDVEQLPFDERGIIYVRHGTPEQVIRTANLDLRPNESWAYTLPSGKQQLFHFVVLRDGTDYRLVEDILLAMDPSAAELPYDGVIRLLEDRAAYDARYNLMAARFNSMLNAKRRGSVASVQGRGGAAADVAVGMLQNIAQTRETLATENRAAALRALVTDSDRPIFAAPLPFYYDVYTFKGQNARTDVTAAIAIPASSLEARQVNGAFVYSLQLSLIVVDTVSGAVSRRDTTHHFRSNKPLSAGEHLRMHADLSAPASRSTIHRIVIRDLARESHGQLYGGGTVVPAYESSALMISDIVLAEPGGGVWHRGNAELALVPPRQFLEGEPLTLFYELYNLPAGATYDTEIVLAPSATSSGFARLKRVLGGDGTIRLRFSGQAAPARLGYVQEIRRVSTELKPGKYSVQIRVTNLANQQVVQTSREFVVIGR
jgi:tetratricopeptide (TPR) repeat protein